MTFSGFSVDIVGGIARLTLNDPARGNPIDGSFCQSLCEAAIQLSENPAVRCLLLSAEGKAFSYGGGITRDVGGRDGTPPAHHQRASRPLTTALRRPPRKV